VIENLFQLSLLNDVSVAIRNTMTLRLRVAVRLKNADSRDDGYRVEVLRARVDQMKAEKAEVIRQYEATKRTLARNKARFDEALEKQREHGERVHAAHMELSGAQSVVKSLSADLLRRIRDPYAWPDHSVLR